eukprot:5317690-Amphidinium_carterae.1
MTIENTSCSKRVLSQTALVRVPNLMQSTSCSTACGSVSTTVGLHFGWMFNFGSRLAVTEELSFKPRSPQAGSTQKAIAEVVLSASTPLVQHASSSCAANTLCRCSLSLAASNASYQKLQGHSYSTTRPPTSHIVSIS